MPDGTQPARIAARRAQLPLDGERVRLREITDADAPFLVALMNEAQWREHIGDRGVRTISDAQAYIETGPRASYAAHGSGLWLIEQIDTHAPLGICGLVHRETLPIPDLGFAITASERRHGYARDAAQLVLTHAAAFLDGVPRLLAITSPSNTASQRLLEQLGFRRHDERVLDGESRPSLIFEWTMPSAL